MSKGQHAVLEMVEPSSLSANGSLESFGFGYRAVVVGATGGIGKAIACCLSQDPNCADVIELGRRTALAIDLEDEASIAFAAEHVGKDGPVHLVFNATGILHEDALQPEKALRSIDPDAMARAFAVNAIGPALLMKHFHRLTPRNSKSVIASLSARVGSISDNRAGGWYSYRASKAALNMIWKTAAIEVSRLKPQTVCIVMHPGTVATSLSEPFAGNRPVDQPDIAARRLLAVIDDCDATANGSFLAYDGSELPW